MAINDLLQEIQDRYDYQVQLNEKLYKQNQELIDKTWQDETMAELKAENKRLEKDYWRGFSISEEEEKSVEEWRINHKHADSGAIGGGLTYSFIPTSIGTIGKVKCICGSEFCFRDL